MAVSGFAYNSCREGVRQSQSNDSKKGTSCCMGLPIEEGRGQSIHFHLLKYAPEFFVQRHFLKFNTLPHVTVIICTSVSGVFGLCWRPFAGGLLHFVWDQIQCLQNCLTNLRQKLRRGGCLRKIKSCHKVLFQITFKMKRFCIAFYGSCFVPYLTGIPVLASNVQQFLQGRRLGRLQKNKKIFFKNPVWTEIDI